MTDAKKAEYDRLMAGRRPPSPLVEKWLVVDGSPAVRKLPRFMAALEGKTDYHLPGSPENLAQRAQAGAAIPEAPPRPPLRRLPPPLPPMPPPRRWRS